jgi:hypothetical protein
MGLEAVELVMAIEETFAIEIKDEEAGHIVSVGDLYGLVLAKLKGQSTDQCLTSAAFYRLRRALMDGLRVHRREIRPLSSTKAFNRRTSPPGILMVIRTKIFPASERG